MTPSSFPIRLCFGMPCVRCQPKSHGSAWPVSAGKNGITSLQTASAALIGGVGEKDFFSYFFSTGWGIVRIVQKTPESIAETRPFVDEGNVNIGGISKADPKLLIGSNKLRVQYSGVMAFR